MSRTPRCLPPDAARFARGNRGVAYRAGLWHAKAAVLDRSGSSAVLMGRDGDGEFRTIGPVTLETARAEPAAAEAGKWRAEQ